MTIGWTPDYRRKIQDLEEARPMGSNVIFSISGVGCIVQGLACCLGESRTLERQELEIAAPCRVCSPRCYNREVQDPFPLFVQRCRNHPSDCERSSLRSKSIFRASINPHTWKAHMIRLHLLQYQLLWQHLHCSWLDEGSIICHTE